MSPTLVACPECDGLHQVRDLPRRGSALCVRCGAVLRRHDRGSLDAALTWHLAALILFALANAFPLLSLHLHGSVKEASIPGCAAALADLGWPWLSAVLITTVILAPAMHFSGMVYVLLQVRQGRATRWTARLLRLVGQFRLWGMAEVFVLGILVSYVKLASLAVIVPGPSIYALGAFILVSAAAITSLEAGTLWEAMGSAPLLEAPPVGAVTARQAALVACSSCGQLSPSQPPAHCPRCGASLHSRKPESRERTWALLITAIILYIPANVLPVMRVVSLGRVEANTILGGIRYFVETGSWLLALIIFIASVVVPIGKILTLGFLLISEHYGSVWRPDHRARLYRLTELVGRWSMVDVFVVTLMVAMVELGNLATITPEPGSVAFALMVVATMLAADFFDPRLVWDALEPTHG